MEKHAVSRMIGSPPGYVGYDEGGQLTEKVRRKPYSVILLDEIEKAHPDVYNILLQILEDGRLTDGQGRTVDFRNTIVIMTSNVGADVIKNTKKVGFVSAIDEAENYNRMKERVMEQLKQTFRPELMNRIDEIIVFSNLNEEELHQIINLLLKDLSKRVEDNGYTVTITDAAREVIMKEGYEPAYGARPLKRAIQKLVEDKISEEILKRTVQPGDTVVVDGVDGKIVVRKG